MRIVYTEQLSFDQVPIDEVEIDPGSRDDIPAVLKGIQCLYSNVSLRERVFALLEEHLLERVDRADQQEQAAAAKLNPGLGRPGMPLWIVLVLALLEQGLKCDFDRLAELARKHLDIRRIMGLSGPFCNRQFTYRTVIRNVSLLTPDLPKALNQLVVAEGQRLSGFPADEPLQARADSFVVETNVHYPTDVSLLWDALRCLLRLLGVTCQKLEVSGWRQSKHWLGKVRKLFNRVRSARQRQVMWDEEDVDVACCLVKETQETYPQLNACSFDKGFRSPGNRKGLEELLELNALPKMGRLTKADRKREGDPEFREARRAHPAVESAINNLEQRGLSRGLSRGPDGLERMVGLAMAANLHRIGLVLQRRERAKLKKQRAKRRRQLRRMAA